MPVIDELPAARNASASDWSKSLSMFAIPIASRQARETCRRPRAYHARWIIGLLGLICIPLGIYFGQYSSTKGLPVFCTLAVVAEMYALLAGVVVASDAISAERREETLGLLFLTDLRPRDVLIGKFLASSSVAIFGLLALIPFLGIPAMMGGVTNEHFLLLTVHLLNTLFLSIAMGLLVSTIFVRGWASICAGIAAMLALGLGYPILRVWFNGDVWEAIDFACPTVAMGSFFDDNINELIRYWESIAFNHAFAWALVAITAVRLVYIWRDQSLTVKQQRLRDRIRLLRFGNRAGRKKLRTKLLDANPLAWLANRDYVSSSGLLALFLFAFGGILLVALLSPDWRQDTVAFLATITLIFAHIIVFFRICIAAAHQLSEDRKSGALELLLSTPLSVGNIICGRWLGIARQFYGPALILVLYHIGIALLLWDIDFKPLRTLPTNLAHFQMEDEEVALCVLGLTFFLPILNWLTAGWLGMWFGLRFKSSATAVWTTVIFVIVAPWLFFFLVMLIQEILIRPLRSTMAIDGNFLASIFTVFAIFLGLLNAGVLMRFAHSRLRKYFRTAAADRFHAFKIPFPWKPILRIAGGICVLILIALFSTELWRKRVDVRGAALWAAAAKAYPKYAQASLLPPRRDPIPKEQNLAYAPILAPLNETNRFVRRGNKIRDLQNANPFAQNFPAPTNRHINPPGHLWNWKQGQFVDIQKYIDYAQRRRVLTNVTASGPQFIIAGLTNYEPTIRELIRDAETRPLGRFDASAAFLSEFVYAVSLHAVACLRLGEYPADEVNLILRLAQAVHHTNPNRHSIFFSAFQPIYEGIAQHRWTDADLARFQRQLAPLDNWPLLDPELTRMVAQMLHDSDEILKQREKGEFLEVGLARFAPPGLILQKKAQILTNAAHDLPFVIDFANRRINSQRAKSLLLGPGRTPEQNRLYVAIYEFGEYEIRRNELLIACAIERYRLAHHELPESLTQLAPTYINPLPNDPLNDGPFKYQPQPDRQQYTLSTVGWEHPNPNTPAFQRMDDGDHRDLPTLPWIYQSH